jgi:plastocyanin
MRMRTIIQTVLIVVVVACSGYNATGPSTGGGGGSGGYGGSGGGTGGGGTGGGSGGGGAPSSGDIAVIVGNNFFRSGRNGTVNPAVDTVAAGKGVTWTWTNTGNVPHGIEPVGNASFTTGPVLTGNGKTYRVQFTTPGTYQYDCIVHGSMMTGTIVVR